MILWKNDLPYDEAGVLLNYDQLLARIRELEADLELSVNNARGLWIDAEQQAQRIRELETAIRTISEHNHPMNDKWGNRTIWTAGCPACNPVETVTAALNSKGGGA